MKEINWKLFERPCACCRKTMPVKKWKKAVIWFAVNFLGVEESELFKMLYERGYYHNR